MNGNCHFLFSGTVNTMLAINMDKINYGLKEVIHFLYDNDMNFIPLMLEVEPTTTALLVMGGLIGGIFPDIDNPDSYMGKMSMPVSKCIKKISEKFGKTGYRHRGIFHDISVYAVLSVLSYLFFPYLIGFFIGCFTHCLLDAFNPMGVPILFGIKTLRLGKLYSGSKGSIVFSYVATVLVLIVGLTTKFLLTIPL